MYVIWMTELQVGAQWALEHESIQVGSVTADVGQPTSEQQVGIHSTAKMYASSF